MHNPYTQFCFQNILTSSKTLIPRDGGGAACISAWIMNLVFGWAGKKTTPLFPTLKHLCVASISKAHTS